MVWFDKSILATTPAEALAGCETKMPANNSTSANAILRMTDLLPLTPAERLYLLADLSIFDRLKILVKRLPASNATLADNCCYPTNLIGKTEAV